MKEAKKAITKMAAEDLGTGAVGSDREELRFLREELYKIFDDLLSESYGRISADYGISGPDSHLDLPYAIELDSD